MIITIDGPTASGKSVVACTLAQRLDFFYLNTGFLFRAVAYLLTTEFGYTQIQLEQPKISDLDICLNPAQFVYQFDNLSGVHVFYQNRDISQFLTEPKVSEYASIVSTNKEVRDYLCNLQRQLVDGHNAIVEGRDSGSVVFPHADIKFFLTALLSVRTIRWQKAQAKNGILLSFEQAQDFIAARDERDSTRAIAPLQVPQNGICVDNTELSIDETVDRIVQLIIEHRNK